MEQVASRKGLYRRKGFLETDLPICKINSEEGMGVLLRAQSTRFCCFGKRIIREYGRDEGR